MALITPLPEAIDGRQWDIDYCPPGSGSMDPIGRKMVIPPFDDAGSRFIRAHELGHAKITPRIAAYKQCRKHGVSMEALQACEDLRVHHYLRHAGIKLSGALDEAKVPEQLYQLLESFNGLRSVAAALVSSLYTEDWDRLTTVLEERMDSDAYHALIAAVRLIDKRLSAGKGLLRPIGMRNCTAPAARLFDALFDADARTVTCHPDSKIPIHKMGIPKRAVPWGRLRIEHLPPSLSRPTRTLARVRSFRDEGSVLKAVHRLPVDGRVFCRIRASKGGTVLVDVSGSMRFSIEHLQEIIKSAPAATVAVYSGRRKAGVLTVVAEKGRMANQAGLATANSHGSGNIVDGPGLEWLAKQDGPRIWVSDGLVTGVHDKASADLGAEALLLCNKARIRRVEKANLVTEVLNTHR
jgi:hypothetical protein